MHLKTFLTLSLALGLFAEAQLESRMRSLLPDQPRDDAFGIGKGDVSHPVG
jgi:hypothetical protein